MSAPVVTLGQVVEYRLPRDKGGLPVVRDAIVQRRMRPFLSALSVPEDPSVLTLKVKSSGDKRGRPMLPINGVPWNDSADEFKPGTWRVKA